MVAFLSYGGVVTLTGLSQTEIMTKFIARGSQLVAMPVGTFNVFFLVLAIAYGVYMQKFRKSIRDIKLVTIALSIFAGVAFIYFTARNPIWDCHFIGIEILFLILLGVIIDKSKWVKVSLSIWILILVAINLVHFVQGIKNDPKKNTGSLVAKQIIVQGIIDDAGDSNYTFYSLNPAIYMYDYSYLFKQIANKDISYDPGVSPQHVDVIYLIIPPKSKDIEDFINFRAPKETYRKVTEHTYPDGTVVLKNIRIP